MRKLGIHARLDHIFDAPAAVKEVLISQFGLDNSVCLLSLKFENYDYLLPKHSLYWHVIPTFNSIH